MLNQLNVSSLYRRRHYPLVHNHILNNNFYHTFSSDHVLFVQPLLIVYYLNFFLLILITMLISPTYLSEKIIFGIDMSSSTNMSILRKVGKKNFLRKHSNIE